MTPNFLLGNNNLWNGGRRSASGRHGRAAATAQDAGAPKGLRPLVARAGVGRIAIVGVAHLDELGGDAHGNLRGRHGAE